MLSVRRGSGLIRGVTTAAVARWGGGGGGGGWIVGGSIWNNKVPFDWLARSQEWHLLPAFHVTLGLCHPLLIKVGFWNSNSKTRLAHLSTGGPLQFLFLFKLIFYLLCRLIMAVVRRRSVVSAFPLAKNVVLFIFLVICTDTMCMTRCAQDKLYGFIKPFTIVCDPS